MPGIRTKIPPPANNANPTARPPSCACRAASTLAGPDDNTLKIETDAGDANPPVPFHRQASRKSGEAHLARIFRRELGAAGARIGHSLASAWARRAKALTDESLEVVTTDCAPATCARTGRPTARTPCVKEYYDLHKERNGDTWFTVTTVVDDPKYLTEPFVTSTDFKKIPDGAGWSPSPVSQNDFEI